MDDEQEQKYKDEIERLRRVIHEMNNIIDHQASTILHLDTLIRRYDELERFEKL